MTRRFERAAAWKVTVYCPVAMESLAAFARGDLTAIAADPVAGRILEYIERSSELGNFGSYRGVCELSVGLEAFTPGPSAQPTLGRAAERSHSATVSVAAYIFADVPEERVDRIVSDLAALHPWEVPVLELQRVEVMKPLTPA